MKNGKWNIVFFNRPDVHKTCVWSDGENYFDGFLGSDNFVYRKTPGTPKKEPNAVYWVHKPKELKDQE